MLLVLATALIVARPLVLGEDAGLSTNLADPWGMVLTLLWLLAAVGWAAWRYWQRPTARSRDRKGAGESTAPLRSRLYQSLPNGRGSDWYGGFVQTALLATVALVFVSAQWAAHYKFSARLIAWEWFGLFVSFFVVRQLAVAPSEQHGLFTVVLAGAAALAAQGIYQKVVEQPRDRLLAEDPEAFRKVWAEENPGQESNENQLEQTRLRALENNIFGPYAHPNSYAGFLVLWLPGLIGAAAVCRCTQTAKWQTALTVVCAAVGLAALWLTHSRGALMGLTAAGVGVGLCVYRRQLRGHALAVLIALLVLAGSMYGVWRSGVLTTGTGKSGNVIAQRLQYWRTTWRMIHERPWLGVGPGNFGENYSRLMPASAEEKIKDPHNFALEMWATCGVFALIALLATLTAFFVRMMRVGLTAEPRPLGSGEPQPLPDDRGSTHRSLTVAAPLRWEFYLGGMFGLLLGFVLRVNTATPGAIMAETYSAALRCVVWFAAYGLLERLAWSDRGRALALTTGIIALLLNLCVSGGLGFPSVAGMLWIAVALALNAAALKPSPWLSRAGAAMILPLPIFLGILFGYGAYILYPVLVSDGLVREAVQVVAFFNAETAKPPAEQAAGLRNNPIAFLQKGVIERLQQAARQTPDDARIHVQLAWWTNVVWNLKRRSTRRSDLPIAEQAIRHGLRATQLDPQGAAGYLVLYALRMAYAEVNENSANDLEKEHGDRLVIRERQQTARNQYELAGQILEQYLPNDPQDAALHYRLWHAWSKAGDNEKGRRHAQKALDLDQSLSMRARKLTDRQREQLRKWIDDLKAS